MKHISLIVLMQFICIRTLFSQAADKPNIIFIIIDDLNDYTQTLGGHPQTSTPGINQIESWGTTFLNAHAPAPKCAPSRTSMLSGKDIYYTKQYNNPACKPFRNYFTVADGNDEVFTLPEQLKSFGYYTYGINKIYHCFDSYPDFDTVTIEPCDKLLSWNQYSWFTGADDPAVVAYGSDHGEGVPDLLWAVIPDSMENKMYDYRAVDSAVLFINGFQNGTINTCGNPFFMMIGLRKPHEPWYIPEHYFSDNYVNDFYSEPFNYPYNLPENTFPYNGIVMPPQPDSIYNDFYHLGSLGQQVASFDSVYFGFQQEVDHFTPLPEIDAGFTDEERENILNASLRANAVIAYLAATKFVDAQVKRLIDSLAAYPDIFNNTILVLVGDNGFSLGEKRHWQKSTMWETDLRVPFTIADLRSPVTQSVTAPVNLLDIFPTICELTATPFPTFADGSLYLDGKSLLPFLDDPGSNIEKPSLASYRTGRDIQCACFPQYSMRTNDFHYILYTSNNADNIIACDFLQSWKEEELYEIGTNRETDPNEWNNLASDSSYKPLINYLQQWMPDSAMYLKIPFTSVIKQNELNCLLSHDDTLKLSFDLYDTLGTLITPPAGYIFKWTNNLTADIYYGTTVDFLLQSIPEDIFTASERILIYLQIIDTTNTAIVSLAHAYYYFESGAVPAVSFNLLLDSLILTITDISVTGAYQSILWDFGDGFETSVLNPPPHTFTAYESHTVTCTITYGNNADCIITEIKSYLIDNTADNNSYPAKSFVIHIYPNPAIGKLNIYASEVINEAQIQITDIAGRTVSESEIHDANRCTLDISPLPPGNYIIKVSNAQTTLAKGFQIAK